MTDVLLGLQWGDEGKGKVVDFLAEQYDIIARFQGGPNAGHTLYVGMEKVVLHTIPSGIFYPNCLNLIGNGVVIDPVLLVEEIRQNLVLCPDLLSKLFISKKAHIILPSHRALDAASEMAKGAEKIGSTLKGISPAYMDKTGRNGLRMGDILHPDFPEKLAKLKQKHQQLLKLYNYTIAWEEWEQPFNEAVDFLKTLQLVDGEYWLNKQMKAGKKILAEGAQGSMLDVDFGTYPFVTSSNTLASGVCNGLGIAPTAIGNVIGISKIYCTRVGGGPFPTELEDETGARIRHAGNEFGATTGRPRRCGWIDLVALKYSIMLSGVTELILTKADVLDGFATIKAAVAYEIGGIATDEVPFDLCDAATTVIYREFQGWDTPLSECREKKDLPEAFVNYCQFLEQYLNTPVSFVSNGSQRNQLIKMS
jgi:adenylosuccinate synthase